jgi:hypothetical protein
LNLLEKVLSFKIICSGYKSFGVLNHRLVNLGLCIRPRWCAKGTQGFILVQAKCPASSLMLLILLGTNLQQGLQMGEREKAPRS